MKNLAPRHKVSLLIGSAQGGELVRMPESERTRHTHIVGAPGEGKSKLMESWIRQDITHGRGLCLLDPHGYLYDDIVSWCARRRLAPARPLVFLNAADPQWSFGFNPLSFAGHSPEALVRSVESTIDACQTVWGGEDTHRTPLLRRCLRLLFHCLAEQGLTLADAHFLMSADDPDGLRKAITSGIRHPMIRSQWQDFNELRPRDFQELMGSTLNRLTEFLHSPTIERIVGQRVSTLDFSALMDAGAIVLVNLGGTQLSPLSARLLGSLLVNDLFQKAIRRPEGSRPFRIYLDEAHAYLNNDIQRILNEGRKFGLHLILAHQNLGQLRDAGEAVFRSVFGTARQKFVFSGLDPEDAELFGRKLFAGTFDYEREKKSVTRPVTVGHEVTTLSSVSHTTAESASWGSSSALSEGQAVVTDDVGEEISLSETQSQTDTETSGGSWSHSKAHGKSEALRPILEERPTGLYSLEELRDQVAGEIMTLPSRVALVGLRGRRPMKVTITRVSKMRIRQEQRHAYIDALQTTSPYAIPMEIAKGGISSAQVETVVARVVHDDDPESFFQ